MPIYPKLPDAPRRPADEPAAVYGLRLVLWCLAGGPVAVLTDEQVALAVHAGARASALPHGDVRTYDHLARVRRELLAAARRRARAVQLDGARGLLASSTAPGQSGGRVPVSPAPAVNPGPAGGPSAAVSPASAAWESDRAHDLAWAGRQPSVDVAF